MNSDSYDSFDKPGRSFWARLFYDLTHTSSLSRFLFFLLADILIVSLSLFLSFLVHFDFNLRVPYAELLREILLFFVVLKIGFFAVFRVYRITWRYVGVAELMNIVLAVAVAEMALLILSLPNSFFQLPITGLARRIFLVDGFFTLAFISGLRISKKLYMEVLREKGAGRKGKNTLIIGAGNTGETGKRGRFYFSQTSAAKATHYIGLECFKCSADIYVLEKTGHFHNLCHSRNLYSHPVETFEKCHDKNGSYSRLSKGLCIK